MGIEQPQVHLPWFILVSGSEVVMENQWGLFQIQSAFTDTNWSAV